MVKQILCMVDYYPSTSLIGPHRSQKNLVSENIFRVLKFWSVYNRVTVKGED